MRTLFYATMLVCFMTAIGCREEKTAGEKIDERVERTGESVEDAADEVEDDMEEAAEDTEEAVEDAMDDN